MPIVHLSFEISDEDYAFVKSISRETDAPSVVFRLAVELGMLDLRDEANRVHRENLANDAINGSGFYARAIDRTRVKHAGKAPQASDDALTPRTPRGLSTSNGSHSLTDKV